MSRRGNCYDNALTENFFGILKAECIYRHKPETFEEANKMIDDYIYFYNHERIQLKTGRLPEVGFNVVRVCQQGLEGKMAGVIELVTGGFLQKSVDDLQLFHLFVGAQHCLMGGQQAVWNRFTTIMGRMTRPYSWGLNGPRSISATFQIMAAFSAMLAPTAVILSFGIRCSLFL